MRPRDAMEMLTGSGVENLGPTIWADLGAGSGTFTVALADLLPSGSVIHAIDLDRTALRKIPSAREGVRIVKHRADFMQPPWPAANLDGVLMANSLHFVEDQLAFIRTCQSHMESRRRFLIVEYDLVEPSRWVPYPLSQRRLSLLFADAGYRSVKLLHTRPSAFRRAPLYAVAIGV